jgi:DNA-binding PadR family transcriptional regulator
MHTMDPSAATDPAPAKDPHLPPLARVGDQVAPKAPQDIASAGLEEGVLADLAVKLAYTVARFTTEWVGKQLRLAPTLVAELLEQLCRDGLLEETMRTGQGRSHYRITQRGREYAERSREVCAYVGPAPVHLQTYAAMLRWQFASTPPVQPEHVATALSELVLDPRAAELAGLAVSSGRSLFVYGPSGNGKSSLGRQIHAALSGDYWVPHCISVGNTVIRLYDDQIHQRADVAAARHAGVDHRWVLCRRPMVIVGGELTLEFLDLVYSPTLRYYEAPPHLKANGGVFLVDDFGRERVSPEQLLNRFITPMEHHIDYFTLNTGQKVQVPLRHVLIIATNLSLDRVTDPAFLRRMGYRCYLGAPTPEQYGQIFRQYAQRHGATAAPEVIDRLLERYRTQGRELRACEPRDLIERSRDICRFHGRSLELTPEVLDLAWTGYFGNELPRRQAAAEDGKGDAATALPAEVRGDRGIA